MCQCLSVSLNILPTELLKQVVICTNRSGLYRGLRLAGAPNLVVVAAASIGFVDLLIVAGMTYLQRKQRKAESVGPAGKEDMAPFLGGSSEDA